MAEPKRWFITGVSSGLGRALAEAAIGRGDRVWGAVRKAEDRAAFLALGATGCSIADMADEAQVRAAVAEAEAGLGCIDVLVNNAGVGLMGAVEEVTPAEAQRLFAVNVWAPLAALQAALPGMRARRSGRIVNISSVSGMAVWQGTGLYAASKFALEAIGMTLADEVAPLGIKVTNVAPGGLRTDFGGRSLLRAERRIDDYAATAHTSEEILQGHAGQEPNDTGKAAAAILKIVDADEPPRHLLLGCDAMHYQARYAASVQTEIADWIALTTSVAAD